MSWGFKSYNNSGNSNFSSWRGGASGGGRNNYNNSGMPPKRSGAKSGLDKKGRPWVNGWKVSKRFGMVKVFAHPYKKTKRRKSPKSGREYETWIAQITPQFAQPYIQPCLYYPDTRKVIIQSMGVVLNPNANRGGYCGKFTKPKR